MKTEPMTTRDEQLAQKFQNYLPDEVTIDLEKVTAIITTHLAPERAALAAAEQVVHAFASGIGVLPWGKIKAHLPTDLAKELTRYNVKVDEVLTQLRALK